MSDKELKVIILKTLNELERRVKELSENFQQGYRKYKKELIKVEEYSKTEMKTIVEGINSKSVDEKK